MRCERDVDRSRLLQGLIVLVLFGLLMISVRGLLLIEPSPFNPDEAEIMAAARRAALAPWPLYGSYSTGSLNFLHPQTLAVFGALGMPLTVRSAHILAGALYVWWAWAAWFLVSKRVGARYALLLVLPAALYLFAAPEGDLAALGTELLPLSVIVLAVVIVFGARRKPGMRRMAVASFLLGLAFWFKPQCVLLAVAVLVTYMIVVWDRGRGLWANALHVFRLVAAFALPTALVLSALVLGGTLDTFLTEPLSFQLGYFTTREAQGSANHDAWGRLLGAAQFIVERPIFFMWAMLAAVEWQQSHSVRFARARTRIMWSVVLASALLSLMASFPIFGHYGNIWYAACLVSGVIVVSMGRWSGDAFERQRLVTIAFSVALALALLASAPFVRANLLGSATSLSNSEQPKASEQWLADNCPAGSRVQVWGWAAELYSEFDWTPATKFVVTNGLIRVTTGHDAFQRQFEESLAESPPVCIIDAANPSFFGGYEEESAIEVVLPTLRSVLDRCYGSRRLDLSRDRQIHAWFRLPQCVGGW